MAGTIAPEMAVHCDLDARHDRCFSGIIDHIFACWGKVGLLIDDSEDADLRLARELYGAECLPSWWVIARSAKCGYRLLQALLACGELKAGPEPRAVVVADRYLVPSCDDLLARPIATNLHPSSDAGEERLWNDGLGSLIAAGVERAVLAVDPQARAPVRLKLVTSYPEGEGRHLWTTNGEPLNRPKWETRTLDSFTTMLEILGKNHQSGLLRYGPEEGSADVRRKSWRDGVHFVSEKLASNHDNVVLLTGAGASLRGSYFGCGMPPTSWMLRRAAYYATEDLRFRDIEGSAFSDKGHPCVCQQAPLPNDESFLRPWACSVQELLDSFVAGEERGAPLLEALFSRHKNANSPHLLHRFTQAFRHVLHTFDYRFPYHYWLLARLNWHCIVTTNYDRFHERAAAAYVEEHRAFEGVRLGNVLADHAGASYPRDVLREYGLIKPYGSLHSPAELVLGADQLGDRKKAWEKTFELALREKPATVVVLGHAMRDHHLLAALEAACADGEVHLVWVDPLARAWIDGGQWPGDGRAGDWWWTQMKELSERGKYGPIPGTALEFSYDLWHSYAESLPRRQ